jgi:hypothetical protein
MALKYVGRGGYIHGVPARDLTDEEEAKFGPTIREQEKLSNFVLYQQVKTARKPVEVKDGKDGE